MARLSREQIDLFNQTGCLTLADAVRPEQLQALRADLATWIEESRRHGAAFGETLDKRARFDVEPGHSAEVPALRRVASPTELSAAYLDVLRDSRMIEALTCLIGPDLRLHHSKVNSKLPGAETIVKWHQDFTFDPHSNDDVVTCLLFLDDVSLDNGPLMIAPGSHKGRLVSLWQDGRFTGAMSDADSEVFAAQAIAVAGAAGSVCFMHSRLAHASSANMTDMPRSLFIAAIAAADAVPLAPNALPSIHAGMILHGSDPGRIRSIPFEMEAPEIPKGASFFEQQKS
jgi:ectoine hydroxylase-related dioxygenase (phytanoyl-CoA dioxygenase family)